MPIITKVGSPVKGSPTQFTLDKSALAAVTSVAADVYYSDSTNWKEVQLNYKSLTGNQSAIVKFDASLASPTANFAVSLRARNEFNIHEIVIKDFDGGSFKIPRSALTTAEFDVILDQIVSFDALQFMTTGTDGKFAEYSNIRNAVEVSDGFIFGGDFSDYNSVSGYSNLVKLKFDGTVDTNFMTNAVVGGKFLQGTTFMVISAIAVQSDGKILVGGGFTDYGGEVGRNNLVRLNVDGTLDTSFCVNAVDGDKFNSGNINGIKVLPNGKIAVVGGFIYGAFNSGNYGLTLLNSDGTLDTAFMTEAVTGKFNGDIYAVDAYSDNSIIVGGAFTNYGLGSYNYLVRLNSDGTTDLGMFPYLSNNINKVKLQPDGKILVSSSSVILDSFRYFGRLESNGSADSIFNYSLLSTFTNGTSIAIQADGKILAVSYDDYNNVSSKRGLIRLDSEGVLDETFTDNSTSGKWGTFFSIDHILLATSGYILVTCTVLNPGYDGVTGRTGVVVLNQNGLVS